MRKLSPVSPTRALTTRTMASVALVFLAALLLISPALEARTQDDSASVARLEALSRDLAAKTRAERPALFLQLNTATDGPQGLLNRDPAVQLVRIDQRGFPRFYTFENLNAARTISTDDVWPGGSAGLSLTGANAAGELGIWDGGGVLLTHQEFGGRVVQMDFPSATSYHATHVAGTMVASGVNADAQGMSPYASLRAYDWTDDDPEMAMAAAGGMLASNHSYGYVHGWYQQGVEPYAFYWYGDVSIDANEDPNFGLYSSYAADWDQIAHDAPHYLIVKSAGNDRNDTGPADPTDGHYYWDGAWLFSTDYRAPDGGLDGYDSISTVATAKNILTVGAVFDIPGGWSAPADVVMSSFSNWGPTDDGRIKPDLVANGIALTSSSDSGDSDYLSLSGTSMSSPSATGSINLLAQYFKSLNGGTPARAATLKGLLLHTCDEAGSSDGPDYSNGWGLMNTRAAADVLTLDGSGEDCVQERTLADGQTQTLDLYTDGTGPVTVTISWTDLPGAPSPYSLDPVDLKLVNDLDLRLERLSDSAVFMPWVLDPANPSAAATTGDNFRDNVEQVEIAAPTAGMYRLSIGHKGTLSDDQDYSLFYSGLTTAAPTPEIHVAVSSAVGTTPVLLRCQPDGGGDPLTLAQQSNCPADPTLVDATITVTLTDEAGDPVVGFPAEQITVASELGGWVQCPDLVLQADGPTNASGQTTISGVLYAGGSSAADELMLVNVDDPTVVGTTYPGGLDGLQYWVNSSDANGDLATTLSDVTLFAQSFFTTYDRAFDFVWNCSFNLSDVTKLAQGVSTACPAKENRAALDVAGSLGLVFDGVQGEAARMARPGQMLDAYLVLDGRAARAGVQAFATALRTSDNVIIHQREILGENINLGQADDFAVGYARALTGDSRVALVRFQLSVSDDQPAYFWVETSKRLGGALPSFVAGGQELAARPVSGAVEAPVASLNDESFQPGEELVNAREVAMSVAPNPFNPLTTIKFNMVKEGRANITIYDVSGRAVATLLDGFVGAGERSVTWDARHHASGIYFCKFQSGDVLDIQKLTLLK